MSCGDGAQMKSYDANGDVSSRTDFNNKQVCYAYDTTQNLETARGEGATSAEVCATVLGTLANRPDGYANTDPDLGKRANLKSVGDKGWQRLQSLVDRTW
jgi:hypothetical protein